MKSLSESELDAWFENHYHDLMQRLTAQPISNTPENILLSPTEVATLLKIQPQTLRAWRHRQQGPPFVRVNHQTIRYRLPDLQAFLRPSYSPMELKALELLPEDKWRRLPDGDNGDLRFQAMHPDCYAVLYAKGILGGKALDYPKGQVIRILGDTVYLPKELYG